MTSNPPCSQEDIKEKAKEARDARARAHQLADHTRHLTQETEAIVQYDRARRERVAEQSCLCASPPLVPSAETSLQRPSPVELLLVEDNLGDIRLFREALKESRRTVQLSVLSTGDAVLPFLRHEGTYTQAPRPGMLLFAAAIALGALHLSN